MISLPASLRQSGQFLRGLLLTYWLGSTLVIAAALAFYDLWEHQKQTVREGEQIAHLVTSSLRTPMTSKQRQQLLEAYTQANRPERFDRVNVMWVLDRSGRIAHSSRPTWQSLLISDPLFDQMAQDDPDFGAVLQCFRRRETTCMELRSDDWSLHLSGISIVRPVWMPATDLGLPREPFLVMVNFDSGMLIGDVLQDVPTLILISALIAAVLTGGLWYVLSVRMLPQLVEASQTDSLTQLMNRTSFMDLAMEQLAEAEERQGDLVFAILDIDHFKRINDTFGHSCGDAALAHVAELFRAVTRPDDLICRFGGEEFAIVLAGTRETAGRALERIRLQLEMSRLTVMGQQLKMTVSIGAAETALSGYNVDYLYTTADKALYAAKRAGRNRLEWSDGWILTRLAR